MIKGQPCPEHVKIKLHNDRVGVKRDPLIAKKAVETRLKNGSYKVKDSVRNKISLSLQGIKRGPLSDSHRANLIKSAINNPNYGMRNKKHKESTIQMMKKTWNTPEKILFCKERRAKIVLPRKDSQPEKIIQKELKKRNINFQKHVQLIGQPDVFIAPNICIFADGDYWHANPKRYNKNDIINKRKNKTAADIWKKDRNITTVLTNSGYKVLRFWERDIINNVDLCIEKITKEMNQNGKIF